jgi:hypothetical protein
LIGNHIAVKTPGLVQWFHPVHTSRCRMACTNGAIGSRVRPLTRGLKHHKCSIQSIQSSPKRPAEHGVLPIQVRMQFIAVRTPYNLYNSPKGNRLYKCSAGSGGKKALLDDSQRNQCIWVRNQALLSTTGQSQKWCPFEITYGDIWWLKHTPAATLLC